MTFGRPGCGASAEPAQWRRRLRGWPRLHGRDLIRLGWLTAHHGPPDGQGWPSRARLDYSGWPGRGSLPQHPHDPQVWLSGYDHPTSLPPGVDAVVSLCQLGANEAPAAGVNPSKHMEMWLVEDERPEKNPHSDFVSPAPPAPSPDLRDDGHTVLLHCVQAQAEPPPSPPSTAPSAAGKRARECGGQRGQPLAEDLFPGDQGVTVARALFGVAEHRPQQRVDIDERPLADTGQQGRYGRPG